MKLNVVSPGTGIQWVKLGIQTFFKQPLALAGLFFMYIAAVLLVSQVPVVGVVVGGLLVPGATLGLMAATAEATRGRFPMPSILVSAFRAGKQQVRAMLLLGLIYTLSSLAATALATLIAGTPKAQPGQLDPAMLVALALHLPVFVAFWHAPALVHWHGVAPVKSLFFSAVAVMRNFGAHLVYAVGWVVVFIGAGSLFGVIGGALGGIRMAQAVLMPTALLLAAMFSASIYFSFRDSFASTEAPPDPQPGTAP